jgi:hypothetical protein
MEPDFEMILRMKCIQFGIKGPNVLATKLKTIYEIAHGNLSNSLKSKNHLTISSFISVLRLNYEKEKKNSETRPSSFVSTFAQSASKYGGNKLESKNFKNLFFYVCK